MFTISKTPLFSVLLWRKVFGDLFLMMVFHRRSKRIKIFSETLVTKYLYSTVVNTAGVKGRVTLFVAFFRKIRVELEVFRAT